MPFCYSPWTNIDIDPQGNITPCCKFQKQYYNQQFNIQTHSLTEYSNSKLVNNIKQEFLNETWPKGCERCRIEEENNIESKRILDYARWKDQYQHYSLNTGNFITASIAFGNTCNLKCITCGPHSSSRWQKEYFDLSGIDVLPFKFYKKTFVQDFVTQAPKIIHLDIPGGEPFLSGIDEQKELLKYYIDNNQADRISLHYTTNAQVFPESDWWQLWSHFKEVDIQLSIDGVGDRYEYIRYPANWSVLLKNIIKYQKVQQSNIRLSVSHTVSAYNIYYLDEFFTWCYTTGLPRPWLGRVHTPYHMQPEVWDKNARKEIVSYLQKSQHIEVLAWANLISMADESEFFDKFKTKISEHDQYRSTKFINTFPELARYL
jgi:radical SAM protein with 4Fe4S-binding SPASM domain